jgi:hypothetical protein
MSIMAFRAIGKAPAVGRAFTTANMKDMFWKPDLVLDAMEKARVRNLTITAGIIRKSARKSIKNSPVVSSPGDPPRNVTGLLKNKIFYAYDKVAKDVIVGPEKVSGVKVNPGGIPAPQTLEYGGMAWVPNDLESRQTIVAAEKKIFSKPRFARGTNTNAKDYGADPSKSTLQYIEPRPYMWPAYHRHEHRINPIWKDSVK